MSSGTNTERITQNNTKISTNNSAIDNFKTAIQNLPTRATTQSKSVTITENGTSTISPDSGYDGLSQLEITANVQGTFKVTNGIKFKASTFTSIPSNLDFSELTDYTQEFMDCSLFNVDMDMSIATSLGATFRGCLNLQTANLSNTGNVTNMDGVFYGCTYLSSVNVMDTSSVNRMGGMFTNCLSLSNETLNNILKMCINTTSAYTRTKTLRELGLSSTQATTCQSLSNYNDFINAGWTTGY